MTMPAPPCPKSRRRLTILLGFCIWVCGIAVGVGGVLLYPEPEEVQTTTAGRGRRGPEDIARYLREEYNLTDEEMEGVRGIYEDTFTKLREVRRSIQPDMDAVYQGHAERMRALLGEERYERWHADIERKRRRVGQGRLRSTERRMRSRSRSHAQGEGDCAANDNGAQKPEATTEEATTPHPDSTPDADGIPEPDAGSTPDADATPDLDAAGHDTATPQPGAATEETAPPDPDATTDETAAPADEPEAD